MSIIAPRIYVQETGFTVNFQDYSFSPGVVVPGPLNSFGPSFDSFDPFAGVLGPFAGEFEPFEGASGPFGASFGALGPSCLKQPSYLRFLNANK